MKLWTIASREIEGFEQGCSQKDEDSLNFVIEEISAQLNFLIRKTR
jgi:hypothetical protein